MNYLSIHTRNLYREDNLPDRKPGRPRVRKRRTAWYQKSKKDRDWKYDKSTVVPNEKDEGLWLEALEKYSLAFSDICRSFIAGYYLNDEYVAGSWAGDVLYKGIVGMISDLPPLPRDLEKCDVENRLRYIWYQAVTRYNQRNPGIPFENYLFRMSLFELKHWLRTIHPISLPYCEDYSYEIDYNDSIFSWAAQENNLPVYDKILLFYKYDREFTLVQIGKILGCSWRKIVEDMKAAELRLVQSADSPLPVAQLP